MNSSFRIELVGGLRLRRGDEVITRFRTRKTASLLAYLACNRGPQSREVLVEMLWPDDAPEAGRHSLRTALSSLRRQLEWPETSAINPGALLHADRLFVGLHSGFSTDWEEVQSALRDAQNARTSDERERCWTRVVELFHSPFLPGFYEGWVVAEEERGREGFFGALWPLLRLFEARGDWTRALKLVRRGVELDPMREEAHRHLMRLLALSGSPDKALLQYDVFLRQLARTTGVAPTTATRTLALEIQQEKFAAHSQLAVSAALEADQQIQQDAPGLSTPDNAPRTRGTTTLLLLDYEKNGASTEQETRSEQETLRRELQRHAGLEIFLNSNNFLPDVCVCGGAFPGVVRALACALAVREKLATPLRMAFCTGDTSCDGLEKEQPCSKNAIEEQLIARTRALLDSAHRGQIVCCEATALLLRRGETSGKRHDPGPEVVDLGVYHLQAGANEAAPERVFEIGVPGEERAPFPPLHARPACEASLPLPMNRFFGRERETARLRERLAESRLVTLSGPGGSGKTRLMLQVASTLRDERAAPWHGNLVWVPLADLFAAPLIPDAILSALRVARLPHLSPFEQIVQTLGHPPKWATLLLLDNFEHLVEEGAPLIADLLERVPGLTCFVSSRRTLGLPGEDEMPLAPLGVPRVEEVPATPQSLEGEASVRLFCDRARQARPDFALTSRNAPDVAALCRRLEGVPLSLELAAARVGVLSPRQMVELLEPRIGASSQADFERFDVLKARGRTSPARHRTLRAALDWSFQLLDAAEQTFCAQLWIFRGGCTSSTAREVCDDPQSLERLETLRECSWLRFAAGESSDAVQNADEPRLQNADEPRLQMLEVVREYCGERLDAFARAALERRHARCFLKIAETPPPDVSSQSLVACAANLETERDNLRAALAWSLEHEPIWALRLAVALEPWWGMRGSLGEGFDWLRRALDASGATEMLGSSGLDESLVHRARCARALGRIAFYGGQMETALASSALGVELSRALGERRELGETLIVRAIVLLNTGDLDTALQNGSEAIALLRAPDEAAPLADALSVTGTVLLGQERFDEALPHLEEAVARFHTQQNPRGLAYTLDTLGQVYMGRGDLCRAKKASDEGLALMRGMGEKWLIGRALWGRGGIAREEGDYLEARAFYREGTALIRDTGNKVGLPYMLGAVGLLELLQDHPERAAHCFGAAQAAQELLHCAVAPVATAQVEKRLPSLRALLGETAFTHAWNKGRALSWDEALALVLS